MKGSLLRAELGCADARHDIRVARHPSESEPYLVAKILAYALHFEPGLVFSRGVCAGREPTLFVPAAGGRFSRWIEVGARPDPKRLRQAVSRSDEIVMYCYGPLPVCEKVAAGFRSGRLMIFWIDPVFLHRLAKTATPGRINWQLSLDGAMLLVNDIPGNRLQIYPEL